MDFIHYIAWFGCVAVTEAILQLIQLPLRREMKIWIFAMGFVIKLLAAITVAYLCISIINKLIWNSGYLPAALYAVLLCDAFADLSALIIASFRKEPKLVTLVSVILTVVFVLYGTINAETIVPKEHTYTSDKLKTTHRFIFLSDLHYGSSQSEKTVDKAFKEIAEQKPEFILLGGDITDDRTQAAEMKWVFEKLGSLGIPVYYIYGNHDRQSHADYLGGAKYSREELEAAIKDNGLKILRDEVEIISADLAILGREDVSEGDKRLPVTELPALPKDAYIVCVDHSPYQEDDILSTRADLQLSGHTHAGQFFPLQYVYRLAVNNIYGYYRRGNTDLYVSAGIGGWYFPFRTEAHCNYEIINLKPAQ